VQLLAQLSDDLAEAVRVLLDDASSFLDPGGLGFLSRLWFLGLSHARWFDGTKIGPLS